jgi:hypothetical protein
MIPNSPYALESLVLMKAALNMTPPNWNAALKIWEDRIDYAVPISPGSERIEPDQAQPKADPRMEAARLEVERLHQALKDRDRKAVDALTGWIVKDLLALTAGALKTRTPGNVFAVPMTGSA